MNWCREHMGGVPADPTMEALRQRFASGELTQEECEEQRKRLLTA
jgi:uncharacterized membrane protein